MEALDYVQFLLSFCLTRRHFQDDCKSDTIMKTSNLYNLGAIHVKRKTVLQKKERKT
jgi:hypothetical protein